MTPIFTEVLDGVALPKPWQPTHMKSYAKGRAPFRIWTRMVTNREAERERNKKERESRQKMDAIIRRVARETGCSMKKVREYAIEYLLAGAPERRS